MEASITLQHNTQHLFCLSRPPPNRSNLTDSMFTEYLPDLDYIDNYPGLVCLVGDMNIHFDNPQQSLAKHTLTTLSLITLSKSSIGPLISAVISLTGLLFGLTMTSIKNLLLQTHMNKDIIALNLTSTYQSPNFLPYTELFGTLLTLTLYRTVRNIADIDLIQDCLEHCWHWPYTGLFGTLLTLTVTGLFGTLLTLTVTGLLGTLLTLTVTGLLGTLLTLTVQHSLQNFPVFQRYYLLKRRTSTVTICALY